MSDEKFESWAIVEVMGHSVYAGYVTAENIAGAPMLRVDVPAVGSLDAFTKYIAPHALYGITPCTEETAKAKAESIEVSPVSSWSVERQVINQMREKGLLIENQQAVDCDYNDEIPI